MDDEERTKTGLAAFSKFLGFLALVKQFLAASPDERASFPLTNERTGDGTLHEALDAVQRVMCREHWVLKARALWLEEGLAAWEKLFDQAEADSWQGDFGERFWQEPSVFTSRTRWMTSQIFDTYLTIGFLGSDYASLSDRWLGLLHRRILGVPGDKKTKFSLAMMVRKRTGCWRENDPHRDELACRLMLKNYGIDLVTVEMPQSIE
ncbi:MAG: hypothetical protein Q8R07_04345 [Candidatus Uhrbacteria bacterium]|nr:hypothetical protein [Candidatus Uhrbacteria bacterium]